MAQAITAGHRNVSCNISNNNSQSSCIYEAGFFLEIMTEFIIAGFSSMVHGVIKQVSTIIKQTCFDQTYNSMSIIMKSFWATRFKQAAGYMKCFMQHE
jgi:hypothetical protein